MCIIMTYKLYTCIVSVLEETLEVVRLHVYIDYTITTLLTKSGSEIHHIKLPYDIVYYK